MGRHNIGFQPNPGGRRAERDCHDDQHDVTCGRCGGVVPAGTAHIVVNYHWAGRHQLFCPEHCPCAKS